jgi:hypothetical protein
MQRFFLPPVDETAAPPATHATSVLSRILSAPFVASPPMVSRLSHFIAIENRLTTVPNCAFHPSHSTHHLLTPAFKPHSTQQYRAV